MAAFASEAVEVRLEMAVANQKELLVRRIIQAMLDAES
jgi:hypothetical protein